MNVKVGAKGAHHGMNASKLETICGRASPELSEPSFPDLFLGFSTEDKELFVLPTGQQLIALFGEVSDRNALWKSPTAFSCSI